MSRKKMTSLKKMKQHHAAHALFPVRLALCLQRETNKDSPYFPSNFQAIEC